MRVGANESVDANEARVRRELGEQRRLAEEPGGDERVMRVQRGVLEREHLAAGRSRASGDAVHGAELAPAEDAARRRGEVRVVCYAAEEEAVGGRGEEGDGGWLGACVSGRRGGRGRARYRPSAAARTRLSHRLSSGAWLGA